MDRYICCNEQIAFRNINDDDTKMVLSWRNSDHVRRNFIHKDIISVDEHLNWLHNTVYKGKAIQFVVYDLNGEKGAEIPFASVYYRDIDRNNSTAEYGVFIGREDYIGKGYGQKIAQLMTEYGFNTLGFKKIKLRVYVDNANAIHCYTKVGFEQLDTYSIELDSDGRQICFMEMKLKEI